MQELRYFTDFIWLLTHLHSVSVEWDVKHLLNQSIPARDFMDDFITFFYFFLFSDVFKRF